MNQVEFKSFIDENQIEWRWQINDKTKEKDVLILPYWHLMADFLNFFAPSVFDEGGIEISLLHPYSAIWMSDILSHYSIELGDIFPNDEDGSYS
jgi:hypothetical protein